MRMSLALYASNVAKKCSDSIFIAPNYSTNNKHYRVFPEVSLRRCDWTAFLASRIDTKSLFLRNNGIIIINTITLSLVEIIFRLLANVPKQNMDICF